MDDPKPAAIPGVERVHPRLEIALVGLIVAAFILVTAGAGAGISNLPRLDEAGRVAQALGLIATAVALALSIPVTTLRHLGAQRSGGREYDQMRGLRGVRVVSLLIEMLRWFSLLVIALRVAVRYELIQINLAVGTLDDGVVIVASALGLALASALWISLRTPTEAPRRVGAAPLALLAAGAAAVLASLVLVGPPGADEDVGLGAPGRILAGEVALASAILRLRALPTLRMLARDRLRDREAGRAPPRTRAVFVPAILAFALLLVVFLLFILFGVGAAEVFTGVAKDPILIGLLLFLLVAIVGSFALAFTLGRGEAKRTALFLQLPDPVRRRVRLIIVGSAVGATLLFGLAAASGLGILARDTGLHYLSLGLLVALGPYGFYAGYEHNRVRRLEERFPDYLRDLAASHAGGLTLTQAATVAARGEYGELTAEIRKVADQLSWNVSFEEAIARFAERVHTPLVQRAVNLILQADRSGGSTVDVLLAAARDAREIKTLQNERRTGMSLYAVVVYVTFFVFLGVVAVLYAQFAPQLVSAGEEAQSFGGLEDAQDLSGAAAFAGTGLTLADYKLFYFLAAVMQGLGDGIVAGLLSHGRAVLGLRHAFLMVLCSYLAFLFLL